MHAKTFERTEGVAISCNESVFNNWDKNESDDFDGKYSSLTGAPTNVSSFTNDAGYLSSEVDGSTTNEIQSLGLSGTSLGISSGNRTISFPAQSLSKSPTSTIITDVALGLLWQQDYSNGAYLIMRRPSKYAGGEVEFSIFFETTTTTAGVVNFFIRPRSVNHGNGYFDASGINSSGISVSGRIGFGTLYEQNFTIPASRLTNDWWIITIQREASGSTYSDNVVVTSVALSY